MPKRKPPPWGNDLLSTFFSEAEYNERVSSLNLAPIYALLQRLHAAFRSVEETVEKDNREGLLLTRFLMVRAHSSFLAAVRLTMSGQLFESYTLLRSCIEQTWYALHIAKDRQPPKRSEIWLSRNDSDASKGKCKSEFSIKNVRCTHESLDSITAKKLHKLYETTIDFGAHPNPGGVLTAISKSERDNEINYRVGILFLEPIRLLTTLRMAADVAVSVLRVFRLIFPERFKLMSFDKEISALASEVNGVFEPYAQQKQRSIKIN